MFLLHYTVLYLEKVNRDVMQIGRSDWFDLMVFHSPATGLYNRIISWCVALKMSKQVRQLHLSVFILILSNYKICYKV